METKYGVKDVMDFVFYDGNGDMLFATDSVLQYQITYDRGRTILEIEDCLIDTVLLKLIGNGYFKEGNTVNIKGFTVHRNLDNVDENFVYRFKECKVKSYIGLSERERDGMIKVMKPIVAFKVGSFDFDVEDNE